MKSVLKLTSFILLFFFFNSNSTLYEDFYRIVEKQINQMNTTNIPLGHLLTKIKFPATVITDIIPRSKIDTLHSLGIPQDMIDQFIMSIEGPVGFNMYPISEFNYYPFHNDKSFSYAFYYGAILLLENKMIQFCYIEIVFSADIIR